MQKTMFFSMIFLLFSFSIRAKENHNPEISKVCIREANPVHDFGKARMIKSLYDGNIVISYRLESGDPFYFHLFYSILDENYEILNTFDISEILDDDQLYFYADRTSLYFSNYYDEIVEIEIYTGTVKSIRKAERMFIPDFDDIDKSLNDKRVWLSDGNKIGVNYYASDGSFGFSMFSYKGKDKNIVGVANGIKDSEIFVLTEDSKAEYSLSTCRLKNGINGITKGIKFEKTFFSFSQEIPYREFFTNVKVTLSPNKKWLVVCLSDDSMRTDIPQYAQFVFYNIENGDAFNSIVDINYGSRFDNIDWDFHCEYFIIYDNGAENIYKVFLPN